MSSLVRLFDRLNEVRARHGLPLIWPRPRYALDRAGCRFLGPLEDRGHLAELYVCETELVLRYANDVVTVPLAQAQASAEPVLVAATARARRFDVPTG